MIISGVLFFVESSLDGVEVQWQAVISMLTSVNGRSAEFGAYVRQLVDMERREHVINMAGNMRMAIVSRADQQRVSAVEFMRAMQAAFKETPSIFQEYTDSTRRFFSSMDAVADFLQPAKIWSS